MCIRVQYAALESLRPWDATRNVITIPDVLTGRTALSAVRATLVKLDVPQGRMGARCWCGEPIRLLPRIPQQRRSEQVIRHGA